MKKTKKKNNLWLAIGAILGIVLLIGILSLMNAGDKNNSSGKDSSDNPPANTLFDIDYSKCQDQIALQTLDGAFLTTGYPTMWITDYLSAEAGTTFSISHKPYKMAFYNKSASGQISFISCLPYSTVGTMTQFTVPDGANCVIIQFTEDNSSYPNSSAIAFENRSSMICSKV